MIHKTLRAFLTTALLLATANAFARPNMWWDHFESGASNQTECVKQAETIIVDAKGGQFASDADSVRAWTEKSVTVAECIQFGDKLIVAIIITSEDPVLGNSLFMALKNGMKKQAPK